MHQKNVDITEKISILPKSDTYSGNVIIEAAVDATAMLAVAVAAVAVLVAVFIQMHIITTVYLLFLFLS